MVQIQAPENIGSIIALALVALLCVVGLVLRTILHSRLVLVVAIIIGIVIAAPHIGGVVATIANALTVLLVVAAGVVGFLFWLMSRSPEVAEVVRDVIAMLPRRNTTQQIQPVQPPIIIDQPQTPAAIQALRVRRVQQHVDKDWW